MRIGISTSVIQRGRTGIAQYLFALLGGFLAHPNEAEVFLFVLEGDLPLFASVQQRMRLVTVSESVRPAVRNIAWHQAELPRLARELRLDVLHTPSYRRMLWPKPCRLVATIHDLAPFHVFGKYDWKRMWYGRVVARRLATRQDAIIAVSETTRRDITRFFGVPPGRIQVIHNGVDHERFTASEGVSGEKRATREKWRLFKPFALYVARLEHPGKNHVRLIRSFEIFKQETGSDLQLVLGGSDWHGAEAIHAAARSSKFASDICFLGFVADSDLPALYRAAELFVYPSLFEGFGMPPIEAMACGCPVICSNRGSLGEVVADAAEIVAPEDLSSIAAALRRVVSDASVRERLRAKGFARASAFDWTRAARETLAVYRRAAGQRVASPPAAPVSA